MAAEVIARRFAPPARDSAFGPLSRNEEESDPGAVRVKVVLTKKQLRQVVASMGQGRSGGAAAHRLAAGPSLDQLLNSMRSRRRAKGTEMGLMQCRSRWRPELQSIPEEA